MCLMLYLATAAPLVAEPGGGLAIESVPDDVLTKLRDKLSLPHVVLVLAGTCSCAFPCIGCNEVIEYDEWMGHREEQRVAEVANLRALLGLVRRALCAGGAAELFPVWNHEEGVAASGRAELRLDEVAPERFVFSEAFVHVLRA
jgi:hypothetical protein